MSASLADRAPRILLDIPSSGADGKNRLKGIFRYMGEGHFWDIVVPSTHLELKVDVIRKLIADGLDGAIVSAPYDDGLADLLVKHRLPTILMNDSWTGRPHFGNGFHFALTDHFAIGQEAARHFLSLGRFAEYGFLCDTARNNWGRLRGKGFARVLRRSNYKVTNFTPPESPVYLLDRTSFDAWLTKRKFPLALFAANDRLAVQAMGRCRSLGLAVPRDVAILGVDNDEVLISSCTPKLSSIAPNSEGAGYAAAKTMDSVLEGKHVPSRQLFKPLMLVERASTAPLSPSVKLVEDAKAFINAHATEGLTPERLAVRLHVSRPLLDLRFRELRQGTVSATIRERQLDEVARLLRTTRYTTRKIGLLCGFPNERSLKNIFRRHFGTTMTDYRSS